MDELIKNVQLTTFSIQGNSSLVVERTKIIEIDLLADVTVLSILTFIGLIGNIASIIIIFIRKKLRQIINIFYLHHCLINLAHCCLFIPFIYSIIYQFAIPKGCTVLSVFSCILITTNILNIIAMLSCIVYRVEDLVAKNINLRISLDMTNKMDFNESTASYSCGVFGIFGIWFITFLLHSGITLISIDLKDFIDKFDRYSMRNCFFKIGDHETYILYLNWIFINSFFICFSIFYLRKIYRNMCRIRYNRLRLFQKIPIHYRNNMNLMNTRKQHSNNHNKDNNYLVFKLKYQAYSNKIQESFRNKVVEFTLNNKEVKNMFLKIDNKTNQNYFDIKISKKKHKNKRTRKRYDFLKQIMQHIKIQFLVILLLISSLMPLFLIIAIDVSFKVIISINVYRILCLIACAMPCLTPLCYITVLIPMLNKYSCNILKSDGMQSKYESEFYAGIAAYHKMIGKRLKNTHFVQAKIKTTIV